MPPNVHIIAATHTSPQLRFASLSPFSSTQYLSLLKKYFNSCVLFKLCLYLKFKSTIMTSETSLKLQLKAKQICRFCCTTIDSLSNIYSAENRIKSKAPLPLQVISVASIEVNFYK